MLKGVFNKINFLNKMTDNKEIDLNLRIEDNKIVSDINFSQELNVCEINMDEFAKKKNINANDKSIRKIFDIVNSSIYKNNSNYFVFTMPRKNKIMKQMYKNAPLQYEIVVLDGSVYRVDSRFNTGSLKKSKKGINDNIVDIINTLNRWLEIDESDSRNICPKCLVRIQIRRTSYHGGYGYCPKCGKRY